MNASSVVCVIGLGYVGLPLANGFAKAGLTVRGYDISQWRIDELGRGIDRTGEVSETDLKTTTMTFSADPSVIDDADVVVVTVPTPIDDQNKPDLSPVVSAMHTIGQHLKKGAVVVLESTVYPGVTEEICGPILAEESGLTCGTDFTLGYSPERINPGDREHTVDRIMKVVSGQDAATLELLCDLYGRVTKGGVHRAPSIKVAEMAKAIENAQRDLNIAYINEVALLCKKLGIRTADVLEAAGTKWNFLKFQPGLVGGHCIGVDPYYLVEKAAQLGMTTHVISAGRAVNDSVAAAVADEIVGSLDVPPSAARVLVLGLTFKENVPDVRNSKSFDVIRHLQNHGCSVEVHDPIAPPEPMAKLGLTQATLDQGGYDAVVSLVGHRLYRDWPAAKWLELSREGGLVYDLKSQLDADALRDAGRRYLSL